MRQTAWALCMVLAIGCAAGPDENALPQDDIAVVTQAISSANAANLAQPELDLVAPTDVWWMHEASAATIDAKIAEGFRLFRLNVSSADPLLFSAAFVRNTGFYARTGGGWQHGRTRAQVQAIVNDTSRRIIDVTPYTAPGNLARYTVVWIGNTGTQRKRYSVALGATSTTDLFARATLFNGRITDVERNEIPFELCIPLIGCFPTPAIEYTAVMVERTGPDLRNQWMIEGTPAFIKGLAEASNSRIIAVDHVRDNTFLFVGENQNPDELHWFYEDLTFAGLPNTDITNVAHADNIAALQPRLGARYTELKRYYEGGVAKYLGLLVDNAPVSKQGPSAGTHPVLRALDTVMTSAVKTFGLPGATLAVTSGDRLVHAQGYGYSHLGFDSSGEPRRVEPTDMFRVASVSKTITALAILRLIEDRAIVPLTGAELTLDTPVFSGIFDAGLDPFLSFVRIRDLLMHRSGFLTGEGGLDWAQEPSEWQARDPLVNPAVNPFSIGNFFAYQNSNYHLLTRIIEELTGESYANYVDRVMFTPLYSERAQISLPRAATFTPGTPQEVATYSAISDFRRLAETPLQDDDWILDGTARYGASTWSVSPIDLLRLMSSADGSKPGVRVLEDPAFNSITQLPFDWVYNLGFTFRVRPAVMPSPPGLLPPPPVTSLEHGGYFPGTTNAGIALRSDGIKFMWAVNSDDIDVDLTSVYTFIQDGLHNALALAALPATRDLWLDYGFAPVPCNADFVNVREDHFQDCIEFWVARGSWPATLSSNEIGGSVYFSGSFQPSGEMPTRVLLTKDQYVAEFFRLRDLNYRPAHVNVVQVGGVDRFTAVWAPIDGQFESWIDLDEATFVDMYFDFMADGFVPIDLFVYGGGTRYLATWVKRPFLNYGLYKDMTMAEYQTRFDEFYALGLYPQRFVAYQKTGFGERYAAIWEQVPGNWAHYFDMTQAQYQTRYEEFGAAGMRLHHVQAYGDKFSAIWKQP